MPNAVQYRDGGMTSLVIYSNSDVSSFKPASFKVRGSELEHGPDNYDDFGVVKENIDAWKWNLKDVLNDWRTAKGTIWGVCHEQGLSYELTLLRW
jgi:hypothetical protein